MATSTITVPAGTTTVYCSEEEYVDSAGNPTADVAVSGAYTVDNGGVVEADAQGLTCSVAIQPGTTNIAWVGKDAAGNPITASATVTVEVPAPNPAVSATLNVTTTAPVAPTPPTAAPAAVPPAEAPAPAAAAPDAPAPAPGTFGSN